MAKVFRLHDGTEGTGWFDSTLISDLQLEKIVTDGKEVANSIPSPFARVELINDAFRWVAKNGIDGSTSQHMLVSEALDIGQLLFSIRKFSSEVAVYEYNIKSRIQEAFGRNHPNHKSISQTFDTFFTQDNTTLGFNEHSKIFLIYYRKELIGSTSPRSLYLSAPITQKTKDAIVSEGSHGKFFASNPVSLLKREWGFIKYIYLLSKLKGFSSQFTSFYDYLQKVKEEMSPEEREKINSLKTSLLDEYEQLNVSDQVGNKVYVQGFPLHIALKNTVSIEKDSGFVISPDFDFDGELPLILPNGDFSENWVYTTPDIIWDGEKFRGKIPEKNEQPLSKSNLPVQNDRYPWLTSGNFFTDTIVKLSGRIDEQKFALPDVFSGYEKADSFLLPLEENYFKFFSADKIARDLKIRELGQGTVEAQLKIKVSAGYVYLTKKYTKNKIVHADLNTAIVPFIKIRDEFPAMYTVGLLDADVTTNIDNSFSIKFFRENKEIKAKSDNYRSKKRNRVKTKYYKLDKFFDRLKVTYNDSSSGYIVPLMEEYNPGADSCAFSIDFGTTNTHIEYKVNQDQEKAFDTGQDGFVNYLINEGDDELLTGLIETEKVPRIISEHSDYKYPLRTALLEIKEVDFTEPIEVFSHINKYLLYHKKHTPEYQRVIPDLKWENLHKPQNSKRVEAYFENVILLLYYKALFLEVSFDNISIKWFYPTSMGSNHRNAMDKTWRDSIQKVFKNSIPDGKLGSLPESIGPYFYYYKKEAVGGLSVSIDIGGGSTDISVYNQTSMLLISSFRFAGNDLFGDGYGQEPKKNGFVKKFETDAQRYLENGNAEGGVILESILNQKLSSHDFSSYLFSLSPGFDYSDKISKDPFLKLVIVVFHAAIVYYVANLLRHQKTGMPMNLLYSGTASKSLSIIDPSISNGGKNFSKLIYYIFKTVLESDSEKYIKCKLADHSKEITCKGGLLASNIDKILDKQAIWMGGKNEVDDIHIEGKSIGYKFDDINNEIKEGVVSSIGSFYEMLDEYFAINDISDLYGIDSSAYEKFKEIRLSDAKVNLETGLNRAKETSAQGTDMRIQESLFFLPLKQEITVLANELAELSLNN